MFFTNLPDFEKEAEEEKKRKRMPKAPSFSLDDMEDARKASYDKGHADGLQAAKDSIEQKTEILIQSLTGRIADLEQNEENRKNQSTENAVNITHKALSALLPTLINEHVSHLITESLDNFFKDQIPKSNMVLLVNPEMEKSVEKYLNTLGQNITLKTDDTIPPTQSKLTWDDGHYEFKPDIMVEQILHIIKQQLPNDADDALDDSPKTPHNDDETSQTQDGMNNE